MDFSDFSARLGLPYLLPNQAQKHVTLNESLRRLDTLIMASVASCRLDVPPASPEDGIAYIPTMQATGAWTGYSQWIVAWIDGDWQAVQPGDGWRVYDVEAEQLKVYQNDSWKPLLSTSLSHQNVTHFGLATAADNDKPFSVRLNSALFSARSPADQGSGNLRLFLNKSDRQNTSSLVFQTKWSGRAELGLAGDDRLSIRLSSDGSVWRQALTLSDQDETLETDYDIVPMRANQTSIGHIARPFQSIFIQSAPSISSDRRDKSDIAPIGDALALINRLQPIMFRRQTGGPAHFGFLAQQVRQVLDDLGFDQLGLWELADPDDADSRQALRQEEFISVLVASVQSLSRRLENLEQSAN